MKLYSLSQLINIGFNYVIYTSKKYNIDESHALKHSMEVFNYANKIYNTEVINHPQLKNQQEIISLSAIIHDMCDKKYMNENNGIQEMVNYMQPYVSSDNLNIIIQIISSMSYSTVNKNGYPNLGDHQLAYHIVREADLLTAYDIDRCIIYSMMVKNLPYIESVERAIELIHKRVLQYKNNDLFITKYSIEESTILHDKCVREIEHINTVIETIKHKA
jgi:hypothetical protein